MPKKKENEEDLIHDQTQILPKREIIMVFCIISFAQFVAFVDQNGIGVILPSMARSLDATSSISWAGTSSLIANTVFQVLYGRLSDLFGRKKILVGSLVLLGLSDLVCGFAVNPAMLYVFRGLAGIGGGGVTALVMMVISDIVSLRDRGKYQGILGIFVGLGNSAGLLIGAGFAEGATWRGLFWLLAPLCCLTAVLASWKLPTNMPKQNIKETIRKIDFLGLFFGSAAVIFILIPISEGGHDGTPWDSPMVISFLCVGGVCLLAFLFSEWKLARLPMIPLSIFKNRSVAAMLGQATCLGLNYYTFLYFIPLYFQNVRGEPPILAAAMQLPMVLMQSPMSALAGWYMSKYNRYGEIMYIGFGSWTLGSGLMIMSDRTINYGWIAFFMLMIGVGTGFTFQPLLVAIQAHSPKAQRAVITSARNFLRNSGGAAGLAIGSAITANVLEASLPASLQYIAQNTFAAPPLSEFTPTQREAIIEGYTTASQTVFIFCTAVIGVAFLLCTLVTDNGLYQAPDSSPPVEGSKGEEKHPDVEKGGEQETDRAESDLDAKDTKDYIEPETSELPGNERGGTEDPRVRPLG